MQSSLRRFLDILLWALEVLNEESEPLGFRVCWVKTKIQAFNDILDAAILSIPVCGEDVEVTERFTSLSIDIHVIPGVGLMVRVAGLGSEGPEFKSRSAVELIPGGVNSACHPSEVGKMSASMLVYCVGVATRPGLCPIAKETA